jgi:NitT/TauT family transport system substrate-binding protein
MGHVFRIVGAMKLQLRTWIIIWSLLVVAGLTFGALNSKKSQSGSGLKRVTVQLDWFPEPEHGGLYQALAKGWFKEAGLDVVLISGGGNVKVTQVVATGRADIGQSATTQIIQARASGVPVTNIAAVFQRMPLCLMVHETSDVKSYRDLAGRTIIARPEAAWIPFLKAKLGKDFSIRPQTFGQGDFLRNPAAIQEGFFTAEPYFLAKAGAKVRCLPLSDFGYGSAATLFTTDEWARNNTKTLSTFLSVFVRGWEDYLTNDPAPAHALMKVDNPKLDDDFLQWCRTQMINAKIAADPSRGEKYGVLSRLQVEAELCSLEDTQVIPRGKVSPPEIALGDWVK